MKNKKETKKQVKSIHKHYPFTLGEVSRMYEFTNQSKKDTVHMLDTALKLSVDPDYLISIIKEAVESFKKASQCGFTLSETLKAIKTLATKGKKDKIIEAYSKIANELSEELKNTKEELFEYEKIIFNKEYCDVFRKLVVESPASPEEAKAYLKNSNDIERDALIASKMAMVGYSSLSIVRLLNVINK